MVSVTKPFIPAPEEYNEHVRDILASAWLTNDGPKLHLLEERLRAYLGEPNYLAVANGTIAIQLLMRAMEVTGEVITTPFSYVATTSAILWEGCRPVFADIDPETFCIDPDCVESLITPGTTAILATNVYGRPCAVERLEELAAHHGIKLIFDAAQAFGATYRGRSVLTLGDGATASFHATKVFHTVEGGGIYFREDRLHEQLELLRAFGHRGDDHYRLGVNGKLSELHAAMGLAVLPHIDEILAWRRGVNRAYNELLPEGLPSQPEIDGWEDNFSYFPILCRDEQETLRVAGRLKEAGYLSRRYFYPSLEQLPYLPQDYRRAVPVSAGIAARVLCLPIYHGLETGHVERISAIVNKTIHEG